MAITEKQIRMRILETIWTICPDAKKIRRNILTADTSKWAGLFRHETIVTDHAPPVEQNGQIGQIGERPPPPIDIPLPQIITHGWIVRRSALRKAVTEGFEQNTFELLGFYGFDAGTDADNTEDRWQSIVDTVAKRFADRDVNDPVWEFDGEDDEVLTERVEFSPIGLIRPGENEYLHFGGGRLVVNIHRC